MLGEQRESKMLIKIYKHAASHEVQEQETGTYVFPNDEEFEYSWIMWLWPDGSAEIYTKRNPKTGAVLGNPIKLKAPQKKKKWCSDSACPLMSAVSHEFGKGCRLYLSSL